MKGRKHTMVSIGDQTYETSEDIMTAAEAEDIIKSSPARDAAIAKVAASDDSAPFEEPQRNIDHLFKNPAPALREPVTTGPLYDSAMEAVHAAECHGLKDFWIVRIIGAKYGFEKKVKPTDKPLVALKELGSKKSRTAFNAAGKALTNGATPDQAMAAARAAVSGQPFKSGTKRDTIYQLLLKGTTVEQAMVVAGWNKSTTTGEFGMIAKALNKSVVYHEGIYTLG